MRLIIIFMALSVQILLLFFSLPMLQLKQGWRTQYIFAVWVLLSSGETLLLDLKGSGPLTWKKTTVDFSIGQIITSSVWVTQQITSKATVRQGCMQAHLEKAVYAESCRELLQRNALCTCSRWDLFCIFFWKLQKTPDLKLKQERET